MRKKQMNVLVKSVAGLTPARRIDFEMLVNLKCAMYSDMGYHAKTIVELIKQDLGEELTVAQIHTRNKMRGRSLRDYRNNSTIYSKNQVAIVKQWPPLKIKRNIPIPAKPTAQLPGLQKVS